VFHIWIALDFDSGKMYLTDLGDESMLRADLDETNIECLVEQYDRFHNLRDWKSHLVSLWMSKMEGPTG